MLIYAGFFAFGTHAVQCVYKKNTGLECPTCGLTRAFHLILTGDFKAALQLNPISLQLFTFFAVELIMRLSLIFIFLKKRMISRRMLQADIIISILLFLACFSPLIKQLFSK
jgi:hypothetical protein